MHKICKPVFFEMCPPTTSATTHEASNKDTTLDQKKRALDYNQSPMESAEPPSKLLKFDANISLDDQRDLDKISPILAFSILQRRQRQQLQVSETYLFLRDIFLDLFLPIPRSCINISIKVRRVVHIVLWSLVILKCWRKSKRNNCIIWR